MIARDDATEAQVRAARPDQSTWLSANAGSGKTRVLTDRVARLLLSGVLPQHILCLTYTKAAASEMQNRLFKRLGAWAMKPDADLRKELDALGVEGHASDDDLRRARTLFARAIETPGGLKIQTIHSFCAALLRRFPLEAGVSPLFAEMEDRAAALLREEIAEAMAEGDDAPLLRDLARHFTGQDLTDLTRAIVNSADRFRAPPARRDFAQVLDVPVDLSWVDLQEAVFLGGEQALLDRLIPVLRTGTTNDLKAADKLATVPALDLAALPVLEGVFLTGKSAKEPFSAKLDSFPTKALRGDNPDLIVQLEPFMLRVEAAREQRLALAAIDRAMALGAFAHRFLQRYETQKQLRGWLDFDDLILRARNLLSDPAVAEWVLYRLDGGIDHILVDEAQDTSPAQWQVIERLAQEFTSGAGARSDVLRTIFVVGDKKQSIYSFQGADPSEFDRMRDEFAERLRPTERPLETLSLEYSFRSSDAILRLVDHSFTGRHKAGFPQEEQHRAFHADLPGRVDLWPLVEPAGKTEKADWFDPVDRLGQTHHAVILAERVADEIARMIAKKEPIPAKNGPNDPLIMRPVTAGDFLILVRRRSDLFHEIIRACKSRNLPIAGADRLKVGGEMAVRDLAALLSFLATPEDDLSLATALRSPLFGWSEQQLFDLAHRRTTPILWTALRQRREEFPKTLAMLDDLRGQTDFLRPYDLIERILTRHQGRRALLSRLGAEAEDGINALLSQALAFERNAVPSLTGFLLWMETDDLEIKRQLDSAGDRIRVMTVHGSKGLESPIVILPDTGQWMLKTDAPIVPLGDQAVWNMPADATPRALLAAREAQADAQRAERLRLLYVAATRAEKWLIVAAAGNLGKDGQSWYDTLRTGLEHMGADPWAFDGGPGLRYQHGDWGGPVSDTAPAAAPTRLQLPEFLHRPAPPVPSDTQSLSPSSLGGTKALPGEAGLEEDLAKERGTLLHLLLEHLPDHPTADRPRIADTLLRSEATILPRDMFADLIAEAGSVLDNPDLSFLFAADWLVEAPFSASLGPHRLTGIIDRLLIASDKITAVDFKSNAIVPATPERVPDGILRQMGAYAHALAQIFPDRPIETAILWTRTGAYMRLPHDLVTDALMTTGYLDAPAAAP